VTWTSPDPVRASAFLDTTVPCDRILAGKKKRSRLRQKLAPYGLLRTSRFVQLEFSLGAYGHLAAFQARAEQGASVEDLMDLAISYTELLPPNRQRRVGIVMLKTIRFFVAHIEQTGLGDGPLRKQLRGFLRRRVRRAWRIAFQGLDAGKLIDPSGHLGDLTKPHWSETSKTMQSVVSKEYLDQKAPLLAGWIRSQQPLFALVLATLEGLPSRDKETDRRIVALKKILAGAEDTHRDDIRNVGDAFIAAECPKECVLLSSNAKHFEPLLRVLGKACDAYS